MLFSRIARLAKSLLRKKIKNSDKEILLILDPSKTDIIPMLNPFHKYLLKRSIAYYRWHLKPYAQLVHWLFLLLAILSTTFIVFSYNPLSVRAEAKVWDGGGLSNNWSDALNWLPDGAPAAGDSVTFNSTNDKNATIDNLGAWGLAGESITINGDAGATDGYDGRITLSVAIPNMGAFAMTGANSSAIFTQAKDLTAASFSMAGGTFNGGVANNINISGNVDLTGGGFNDPLSFIISGNFTLAGATYTVGGTITLSGSWTFTSGAFAGGNPSVTFNNNALTSTISGSTTFNSFTCITTGKHITFNAGDTQTITTLILVGGAGADQIVLRSTAASQWNINPTNKTVSYVDVQYSNNTNVAAIQASTSTNSGNNTNWSFVISLAGTIGGIGPWVIPSVLVNGVDTSSGCSVNGGTGEYICTTVAVEENYGLVVYNTVSVEGAAVTNVSTTTNITGFNINDDEISAHTENANPVTNATFTAAKGAVDLSTFYTTSGSNLTLATGKNFVVWTGDTYTPGGQLISGNVAIQAGATLSSNEMIALTGYWNNDGTFTAGSSSTVILNGNIGQTIYSGNSPFWNLTINNSSGAIPGIRLSDEDLDVNGDFYLQRGIFTANGLNQNYAGGFTLDVGTGYTKGATLTFDGATDTALYTDSTVAKQNIGTVVVGGGVGKKITLASNMTVDSMDIAANNTLDLAAGGYILKLSSVGVWVAPSGGGDVYSMRVNGTLTPGTSTVQYSGVNGAGDIGVTTTTYNSVQFSGAETYELEGNLTGGNAMTGSLTIDVGAILDASNGNNYGIALAGNWDNNGSLQPQNGTVTFNIAAGTQTIDNGAVSSFYNLTLSNAGIKQLNTNRLDMDGTFSLQGGTFDANGLNQLFSGNVELLANTTYIKGGTVTFNHATAITYTDSNNTKQNIGTVQLLSAAAAPPDNQLTLSSSMTVDTMTINVNNVLNLNSNGYTLQLAGAVATPLTATGTLTPGTNSTVQYSGVNAGGNVNVTTTTYCSVQFSGAETYVLTGNLTGGNALGCDLTIDNGATLDAVAGQNYNISLTDDWTNTGTFTPRSNTVTFLPGGAGISDLDSGGTGAGKLFNNLTHGAGGGMLRLINNDLNIDGNFTNSAGVLNNNGQNITIAGNWDGLGGTFQPINGTVTFDLTTVAPALVNTTLDPGAGNNFWNLAISNGGNGGYIVTLTNNALDINGNFSLTNGLGSSTTFNTNALNQNYAGNFTLDVGTTYTKGGTLTFDGAADRNYTDSTAPTQNIGNVIIGGGAGNELTLASGMTVDTMDIDAGRILDLGSRVLDLAGSTSLWVGPVPSVYLLRVNGTLTPGNSEVRYSGVNGAGNIAVTPTTYSSLAFTGAETYVLGGNLTGANALTGTLAIQLGTELDAVNGQNYNIELAGNWRGYGTFTSRSNTVTFSAGAGTQTIDSAGGTGSFNNLTHSGAGTLRLLNTALDVNGNFLQSAGTFNANALDQNYAGNFTLDVGTTYTKGGTITFDGAEDNNYTDSTAVKQNIGTVVIGGGAGNELTLASSMNVDTVTVNRILDLASNGYTLNLANAGAVADVLTVTGTLNPGTNSTVQYSATNAGGNINVTTTTYNSVQFSGAETYIPAGDLTGANSLTGSLTIDGLADLNANGQDITLAANWTNNGVFSHGNNTVTFNDATQVSTIAGNSTFWDFNCTTAGKTLTFTSGSTQTVTNPASWTITGAVGNFITLNATGAGQWFINPVAWNVNFVNVQNSVNQAVAPIDPVNFVNNGNNVNWFPVAAMQWCAKENQFIPAAQWTSARCDVPGGGGGPVNQWCEKEQQFIPQDEWTEARCAPPATSWCEAEQRFIPQGEWNAQRCTPPPASTWCEKEQRFIPQGEFSEERCTPPASKWCEFEQHFIPEEQWTEERCTPPGTQWCEAEQQYIPIEQWTQERCLTPSLRWCRKEQQYLPEQEWTEKRCVTEGARWCEVEKRYMPEEEWTEEACVPPGTRWCEVEQKYIPIDKWTDKDCVPVEAPKEKKKIDIIGRIRDVLDSPLAKAVIMTGLIASGIGLVGLLSSPLNWWLQLLRLLSSLMVAFGLKRKSKAWGTVYDSVTKQPLDPAYVMLNNTKGEEVNTSITDLDGRYGFLAEPGSYTMIANKTHYKFPSQKLAGLTNDEIYSNLYFGGDVDISKEGDVIARDIPLDPEKFDWNEFAKRQKNLMKLYSQTEILYRQLADILFLVGFASAILSVLLAPDRTNFTIVVLYIALGILISLNIKTRTFGQVTEKDTGYPLSFAILRVFNAGLDHEMIKRVANKFGRYYILVPPGKYYLKIEKKLDDGSYSEVFTSKVINAKYGVIQNRFVV